MAALRVRDVQRGKKGISLQVTRTYCRHSKSVRNRTKGGKSRTVPLGEGMTEFLEKLALGKDPEAPLLWNAWNECEQQTKFTKHFKRALKEAGVRVIRIHDLRHTYAVHFLEEDGEMFDLQNILGHQSQRLTERYSHFSQEMSERSRGLVDHGCSAPVLTVIDGGKPNGMLPRRCPENRQRPLREGGVIRSR